MKCGIVSDKCTTSAATTTQTPQAVSSGNKTATDI